MATYAIGDLQGCLTSLMTLLDLIGYNSQDDQLWFTGDLINRGPESLETLRFVKSLGHNATVVLGNHDLHLLAVSRGLGKLKQSDTFIDVLSARDRDELIGWLCHQPLCHYDDSFNTIMTHAGIPPCWTLEQTRQLAKEVETKLKSDDVDAFLVGMYGNTPQPWHNNLVGMERLRAIINYLTRMRFCDAKSNLDLKNKEGSSMAKEGYAPWFVYPSQLPENCHIIFGHWSALEGMTYLDKIHALDTGCVWGGSLTALELEDKQLFSVPCKRKEL